MSLKRLAGVGCPASPTTSKRQEHVACASVLMARVLRELARGVRVTSHHTHLTRQLSSSQPKIKVVVTARAFEGTMQTLRAAGCDVLCNEGGEPWTRAQLVERAHDAQAMLAFMTDTMDVAFLEACPRLELVACALKGFDNFDTAACCERGVAVTAVPDLLTAPTAELAVGLALGLGRRLLEADACVRSGHFQGWRPRLYGSGLAGAKVGIFGAGAVGQAVAKRLRGFDPGSVLYVDPVAVNPATERELGMHRATGGLEELLASCDYVVVCTPLTASTRHSVDSASLRRAGNPSLRLVNISRGSCVDEAGVAVALEAGVIAGYAADVFEFEDWAWKGRPGAVDTRLLLHPRTLFSPHLGSAVTATRREIEQAAAEEIVRWVKGQGLRHRVN